MSRSRRRWTSGVAALALGVGGTIVATPPAQAITACDPDSAINQFASIDGDLRGDVAIGVPSWSGERGAVEIVYSNGQRVRVDAATAGFPASAPGDRFGASVSMRDLDGDGCAEVAIGAPGRDGGRGAVYLLRGTGIGIGVSATGGQILTSPLAQASAHFGHAVSFGGSVQGGTHELWVGAPDHDVVADTDAGAVAHFGVAAGAVTAGTLVTQDSPGVPGGAETGDRFGSVLSSGTRGVLVGTPEENIGSLADAGSLTQLRFDGDTLEAFTIDQNSPGVPGGAEAGDRFGAAVATMETLGLIGVPGEDLGSAKDAGSVQLLRLAEAGFDVGPSYDQGTPGVPGANESGDRFGTAVLIGRALVCQESLALAVGAPGEDVGSAGNTGAVTFIEAFGAEDWSCPDLSITQNTAGIPGANEDNDGFGTSLALLRYRDDFDEDIHDSLVIGVPGEDLGSSTNAGNVLVGSADEYVSRSQQGGAQAGVRYGTFLGRPGGGFS